METVRVRFAPSPTGNLHMGGARSALFNWLFARHTKGVFVLRIEDTDLARSTEEATQVILDGMQFLGLDWDEGPQKGGDFGPYFQSQRLSLYQEQVGRLLEMGRAYECYCTPEELDQRREAQIKAGEALHYDGRCAHLSEEEKAALKGAGRTAAIRFRTLVEGKTEFKDLIRNTVSFENTQLDDFVIIKSDGMPTYNFAVVVDDALMEITHVIRAEEHLSNTPKQLQIYEALGFEIPIFAHIPLILGSDKAKLSKRHGATSVLQFQEEGYLPEALMNYLALLGWGYDDSQTIFGKEELIEKFTLERVSRNPAVFDFQKLEWMNGVYLRELTLDQFYRVALPFWQKAGFLPPNPGPEEEKYARDVLEQLQSRVKLLAELVESARYFFTEDYEYDQAAVGKFLTRPQTEAILEYVSEAVGTVPELTEDQLKPLFKAALEKFGVKMGGLLQPVRVALTGTSISPGMYEMLAILGRDRVQKRIERTLAMLKKEGIES